MSEPQAFDPSKPFELVSAPPPPSTGGFRGLNVKPAITDAMRAAGIDPSAPMPSGTVMNGPLSGVETFLQKPMIRGTGNEAIDSLTTPANALLLAMGVAPRAFQALSAFRASHPELVSDLASLFKPKAVKALELAQKYARAAPEAVPSAASAPPAAVPVEPAASAPVVPAPQPAQAARTAAPGSTAESTPSAPRNALPDQKALNEEALMRRRAEYQARQAEPAAPATPEKFRLVGPESKEYVRLVKAGKSSREALELIQVQRDLAKSLGLTTPTAAETTFPKGMRGRNPK